MKEGKQDQVNQHQQDDPWSGLWKNTDQARKDPPWVCLWREFEKGLKACFLLLLLNV
jgi:hypothetical protein